jgi:hypothetical protein
MILHNYRDDFEEIVLRINAQEGIRSDILEKDYYVTLVLEELSRMQHETKAYFKGGTALYKALSSINRFSEDIDLTVSVDGLNNSQAKKRLEKSALEFECLELLEEDPQNSKSKGSITTIYGYDAIFNDFLDIDPLQRFGRVKIEATNFSVSEPFEFIPIAPALYDYADDEYKKILRDQFNVKPFEVQTIKLERIFIDKIFAAEFYYDRFKKAEQNDPNNCAFDVAKHIYDLMVLYKNEQIIALLGDQDYLQYLISLKRVEELSRYGGIPASTQINDFSYLSNLLNDEKFHAEYTRMQEVYVFKDEHKIPLENATQVIHAIRGIQEL